MGRILDMGGGEGKLVRKQPTETQLPNSEVEYQLILSFTIETDARLFSEGHTFVGSAELPDGGAVSVWRK